MEPENRKQELTVNEFFQIEPESWGLRGDPCLWRELGSSFAGKMWNSADEFYRDILTVFRELTGRNVETSDIIFVERYVTCGMSAGMVSPMFWTEKAIPLLMKRFKDKN